MKQSLSILKPKGRIGAVGISTVPLKVHTYTELIPVEAEIIGVSDHQVQDIEDLLEWAGSGVFTVRDVVSNTVPLDADAINAVLDELDRGAAPTRTVILPE